MEKPVGRKDGFFSRVGPADSPHARAYKHEVARCCWLVGDIVGPSSEAFVSGLNVTPRES